MRAARFAIAGGCVAAWGRRVKTASANQPIGIERARLKWGSASDEIVEWGRPTHILYLRKCPEGSSMTLTHDVAGQDVTT